MAEQELINYGAGMSAPGTWRNFDSFPTLQFERLPVLGRLYTKNSQRFPVEVEYGDIVRGLPVPDGSAKLVYCSHVLEHLSLEDARLALRNTYRLLRPGGVFRCVLPDLEYLVARYSETSSPDAAHDFMRESGLGRRQRPRKLTSKLSELFGSSQHLWLYDYKALEWELRQAGFQDIRRAAFGDSKYPEFVDVEEESRWLNALGVECRK